MAWVQTTLLGYVNVDNIVTLTNVTSRVSKINTANKTDYYFKVITNSITVESAMYDSQADATTARNALKTALGI